MSDAVIQSILRVDGSAESIDSFKGSLTRNVETINDKIARDDSIHGQRNFGAFSPAANFTILHISALIPWVEVCNTLCCHGAYLEAKDCRGRTPARWAAETANVDILSLLLLKGTEIDSIDRNGWTMLHMAAQDGHEDICSLLLHNGASVNMSAPDGKTALHFSSEYGHDAIVELLLGFGANILATDDLGWTALKYAADQGHERVCDILLRTGAIVIDDETFHLAVGSGSLEVCTMLINQGSNLSSGFDSNGKTPIMVACERGYVDICSTLLEAGADVSAADSSGIDALQVVSVLKCKLFTYIMFVDCLH
jgi:ankyrin repeat protein